MTLEGKVAFVTGASGGIGAAVSRKLAEQGVKVGMASRRGDGLGVGLGLECNVRDRAQVEAAVARTVDEFGRLDICVANAGTGSYHPFLETPVEHIEEMVELNLLGTIWTIRACRTCSSAAKATSRSRPRPGGAACPAKPSTARRSSVRSG